MQSRREAGQRRRSLTRRELLEAGGLTLACGLAGWGVRTGLGQAAPTLLRPPGARRDAEFLASCIRCGLCVEACPYGALRLAPAGEAAAAGTPHVVARQVPCSLCQGYGEMRCMPACPTGALRPVAERSGVRMGVAVIDRDTCFAWNDVICRACWQACPFPGVALALDSRDRAVVNREACVGCGICEHVCVTEPGSIRIVPSGAGERA